LVSDESITPEPVITARGIAMTGPWGPVYGPVDLDVEAGGVTVLLCPAGTGRTALLMTLAGRMRPVAGELTVCGRTRAKDIFGCAALAGIDELDTVAESVTVRDLITEQLRWDAPWYRLIRQADEDDLHRICDPVFGEVALPPLTEYVEELTELGGLLLRIALANSKRPPLLVVGNLDQVTSDQSRAVLVDRLIALGGEQTVVTATANPITGHEVSAQIEVPNTSRAELVSHEGDK
jgi:predicted ABC-type transport system involved in lysophospholipase L1 biosynthesis ATPase subunit